MSEGKHTPGPWEIARKAAHHDGRLVIESYGFGTIAALSVTGAPHYQDSLGADDEHHAPHQEVMEANARLIAAAPDLLAALIEALPAIERETKRMVELIDRSKEYSEALEDGAISLDYMARAAIAKATGQDYKS